ncbi:MAG TPA: FtsX-like permease family protein [Actinomycetales bacterium]|nr:FtsX-like permease family protein [Actinomycetales bacterium]
MLRLALAQVLAHRSRFALCLLAVVLGVTFVAGSLVLTDTSQKVFDDQFATASAGVDLTVRDAAAFDSAMGVEVERDPLPASLLDKVESVPGVAEALPVARGQGLLKFDGQAIVPKGPSMLSSWAPQPFSAFLVREGHEPKSPGEMVVDAATAKAHGIALGDTVTVISGTTQSLRVVGLVGFDNRDGLPNTTVALVSLPTAQELLQLGAGVSELALMAEEVAPVDVVRDDVAAALGADYSVTESQDVAAASAAAAKNNLAYIRIMLLALSAAGLLVGSFLIANTFNIVITSRTRELALLRAAGATGRQVVASVLGEAALVGVVGAALGNGLGVAAAAGLRDLTARFGVALPSGTVVVLPRTVLVALLIGVLVTVLAALGPARRAARVAPVEAMRASAAARVVIGRGRVVVGTALAAVGLVGLAVVLATSSLPLLGLGTVMTLVGVAMLAPVLTPRLVRLVGRPLEAGGVTGELAREGAARAPRRTAATAMALAIGLALMTFISVVGTSVKTAIAGNYREVLSADFVIESARSEMLGGLSEQVHHHVAELPEVAVASRMRFGHWKDAGATRALTALDPETIGQVARIDMVAGNFAALADGGIVIAQKTAEAKGLSVGDELPMTFSRTGAQRLRVVGIIRDASAQALSTNYLISLDTYASNFSETMDAAVFVKVADGVTRANAKQAIDSALKDMPTADVRDQAAAAAGRTAMVDQILGLVTVLLLLAVVIALLGITNTLALSVVERTREVGLLRAVGMTRKQLRWMVRGEAVLVAAMAVVLGVGLGVLLGAVTVAALRATAPMEVTVPLGQVALIVAAATVAGLVAGLLPARRATRMDVLAAIATE